MNTKIKISMLPILIGGLIFMTFQGCIKDDTEPYDTTADSITFNPDISYGTMKDAGNNSYKTVTIGTQTWMAENLRTTVYNDGTPIPEVNDNATWRTLTTGAQCISQSADEAEKLYGRLYNWYTVNTGKLCPAGWRVPTNADWVILENFLKKNGYNYFPDDTVTGSFTKSLAATTLWKEFNAEGTVGYHPENNNITGFTALPGGMRYFDGGFGGVGEFGCWWSSTESFPDPLTDPGLKDVAFYRLIANSSYYTQEADERMKCGVSVRCVKN